MSALAGQLGRAAGSAPTVTRRRPSPPTGQLQPTPDLCPLMALNRPGRRPAQPRLSAARQISADPQTVVNAAQYPLHAPAFSSRWIYTAGQPDSQTAGRSLMMPRSIRLCPVCWSDFVAVARSVGARSVSPAALPRLPRPGGGTACRPEPRPSVGATLTGPGSPDSPDRRLSGQAAPSAPPLPPPPSVPEETVRYCPGTEPRMDSDEGRGQ